MPYLRCARGQVPGPTEHTPEGVQKGVTLSKFEYVVVTDHATGRRRVVQRETVAVRNASPKRDSVDSLSCNVVPQHETEICVR